MRSRRGGPPGPSRAALPPAHRPRRARPATPRRWVHGRGLAERHDALPPPSACRCRAAGHAHRSRPGTNTGAGTTRTSIPPAQTCPDLTGTDIPVPATSPAHRCNPETPGGGVPAPSDTRTYAQHTGRMRARRPDGRRTPPPRHPAPTGPSGTGQHGRRTSEAARPAGSACASGHQLRSSSGRVQCTASWSRPTRHPPRFASIRG